MNLSNTYGKLSVSMESIDHSLCRLVVMENQCRAWLVGLNLRHYRRAHKPAYRRLPCMCSDTHIPTDTRAECVHTRTYADNAKLRPF